MTLCQTRRIFFSGLLFIIAACSDRSFADDWPGFQGADRDGVVHDTAVLTDWPEGGPAERWARDIGPGFGGAAIKDGRVYLLDRDGIAGDVLRVFDLETGRSLWSAGYDAPGRISYHGSRSTPMVTDTHAYTVGSFGQVTAFDLERQCVAWQHHMDDFGADPPKWAWSQSPLIVQGSVVVAPMASEAGLVALDPETGNVRWRSPDIGRGAGSCAASRRCASSPISSITVSTTAAS
ncbi:MAG: PQQ-binding-like beta-propeller repeat protein, partial [Phycisphaeraceae bacterium]